MTSPQPAILRIEATLLKVRTRKGHLHLTLCTVEPPNEVLGLVRQEGDQCMLSIYAIPQAAAVGENGTRKASG